MNKRFLLIGALFFNPIVALFFYLLRFMDLPIQFTPLIKIFFHLDLIILLPWLLFVLLSPFVFFFSIFFTKYRQYIGISLIIWIISWISLPISCKMNELKNYGLKNAIMNAENILFSLEKYYGVHNKYPENLNQLIPNFIDKIPYTGLSGYPYYKYSDRKNNSLFKKYELRIETPLGPLNWDVFLYWPEKNYPEYMYGGRVEKIYDWAYVHE